MMRRLLVALCLVSTVVAAFAESDQEVNARNRALDLAGAFSNDGFKIRDGHWAGDLKPKNRAFIAVNLYAGNQYWFTAAGSDPKDKLSVELYDEKGLKVKADDFQSDERTAAGFTVANSGQYFVAVTLVDGPAAGISLVYAYK